MDRQKFHGIIEGLSKQLFVADGKWLIDSEDELYDLVKEFPEEEREKAADIIIKSSHIGYIHGSRVGYTTELSREGVRFGRRLF